MWLLSRRSMTELTAAELPSEVESDNDTDDDSFLPDSHHDPAVAAAAAAAVAAATGTDSGAVASPASVRLILPKNRLSIQRRATVTGASPTSSRPPLNIEQVSCFLVCFSNGESLYFFQLRHVFVLNASLGQQE